MMDDARSYFLVDILHDPRYSQERDIISIINSWYNHI